MSLPGAEDVEAAFSTFFGVSFGLGEAAGVFFASASVSLVGVFSDFFSDLDSASEVPPLTTLGGSALTGVFFTLG